ncbi:MAG TPA: ATPase, T2SS/T4P/T4SS family [Tepidisphaeraceae bacterium]|jgi:type IV pilus assembly protein PilB|nr:ATPase, T2SS/T4P/T4SS family [Tepidisphaeraceae bacterium]
MFGRRNNPDTKGAAAVEELDDAAAEPEQLWAPADSQAKARKSIELLLLERAQINEDQLAQAKAVQAQTPGKTITQILVTMNAATEGQVLSAMAHQLGLAYEAPEKSAIDEKAFGLLPPEYIRKNFVLPLRFEGETLIVGMADPNNVFLIDELRRKTKRTIKTVVTASADINRIVEQLTSNSVDMKVDEIIKDIAEDDIQLLKKEGEDDNVTDLEKMGSESPIIRFVNYLIFDAIKQGASDIHIEPKEKALKVRYRIDGVLFEAMNPPYHMHPAIVSRLKIMSNLDISERRLPQDGRVRAVVHGRKVDLRLSTLPTVSGEKVVMRILDNRSINVELEDLGFSENSLTIWKNQIDQPHGILLVTGPTGSGKTTTLYSSLRVMDGNKLNIATVEDPIEYHLNQACQVQVHDKIGMTFSAALRSLLRQDPDVIMLGEIRDPETARIAVQASLTGHLVLSTLHTNDAPGSITRLINIGVEPYLISAAVHAILAQRLVRKICPHCREDFAPSDEMKEFLQLQGFGADKTFKGKGCDRCRKTGYTGRLGIYELLVMDDTLRDLVTANPDVTQLRKLCRERGLITLREDGFAKVMKGLTTVDEILRVTENSV